MAWLPAIQAVRAHLEAEYSGVTVAWDGEEFDPPARMAWVLARFVAGDNAIRGVGTPGQTLYERDGLLHLFIHTPKHSGQEPAAKIADALAAVFLRVQIAAPAAPDYVRFEPSRVDTDVATHRDGAYDVTLLSVPFSFFHFR
jgi:hypothetical protein